MVPRADYEHYLMEDAFYWIQLGHLDFGVGLLEYARRDWIREVELPDTPLQRFLFEIGACLAARLDIDARTLDQVVDDHCFTPNEVGWIAFELAQRGMLDRLSVLDGTPAEFCDVVGERILADPDKSAVLIESIRRQL